MIQSGLVLGINQSVIKDSSLRYTVLFVSASTLQKASRDFYLLQRHVRAVTLSSHSHAHLTLITLQSFCSVCREGRARSSLWYILLTGNN